MASDRRQCLPRLRNPRRDWPLLKVRPTGSTGKSSAACYRRKQTARLQSQSMKTTTKSEGYKLHSTYADTARGQKEKRGRGGWERGAGQKGRVARERQGVAEQPMAGRASSKPRSKHRPERQKHLRAPAPTGPPASTWIQ